LTTHDFLIGVKTSSKIFLKFLKNAWVEKAIHAYLIYWAIQLRRDKVYCYWRRLGRR